MTPEVFVVSTLRANSSGADCHTAAFAFIRDAYYFIRDDAFSNNLAFLSPIRSLSDTYDSIRHRGEVVVATCSIGENIVIYKIERDYIADFKEEIL